MKSVIIRRDGEKILTIKQVKHGIETDALEAILPLEITCVMDNNERIKVAPRGKK